VCSGSFCGALSVVLPGSELGDRTILGSLSQVTGHYPSDSLYLGSPPVCMRPPPKAGSQEARDLANAEPLVRSCGYSCGVGVAKTVVFVGKLALPTAMMVGTLYGVGRGCWAALDALGWLSRVTEPKIIAMLVLYVIVSTSLSLLLLTVVLKRLVITFSENTFPMWGSAFVRMTVLQSALLQCDAWVLQGLRGSPLYPCFFALMGATVGRRTYLNCAPPNEFDLLELGDDVCVADGVALLGHEIDGDKVDYKKIRIEQGCSVQFNAVLLPGVHMHLRSELGPYTLGMKGEAFPKRTHWQGSPAAMADNKRQNAGDRGAPSVLSPTVVSMLKDINLLKEIDVLGREVKFNPRYNSVFLTGATGFVGTFLLVDLLKANNRVFVLVRAADKVKGLQRLREAMAAYEFGSNYNLDRVTVICGDLDQPNFGLSESEFVDLANDIDVIIHNGALVNGVLPYVKLAPINVQGTKTCLRLAIVGNTIKHLHYVSTLSVFPHKFHDQKETMTPRSPSQLDDGYAQSKYVAEKVVLLARDRGLPVTIYRLGRISGDSFTGAGSTNDFAFLFIKGCIQLMRYPTPAPFQIDLLPVDYCTRALLSLSRLPESTGNIYHLANDKTIPLSSFWDVLRGPKFNYNLNERPLDRFLQVLRSAETNAFLPLVDALNTTIPEPINIGVEVARAGLKSIGLPLAPVIGSEIITNYIEFFHRKHFLPEKEEVHKGLIIGSLADNFMVSRVGSLRDSRPPNLRVRTNSNADGDTKITISTQPLLGSSPDANTWYSFGQSNTTPIPGVSLRRQYDSNDSAGIVGSLGASSPRLARALSGAGSMLGTSPSSPRLARALSGAGSMLGTSPSSPRIGLAASGGSPRGRSPRNAPAQKSKGLPRSSRAMAMPAGPRKRMDSDVSEGDFTPTGTGSFDFGKTRRPGSVPDHFSLNAGGSSRRELSIPGKSSWGRKGHDSDSD
jgi:thioester reductase-like protein